MPTFTLAISCLSTSKFALIHGPNIPGSYAILLFTALDLASTTSHIHNWVLFLLWLHLYILSGVISALISSSILGTYWPGSDERLRWSGKQPRGYTPRPRSGAMPVLCWSSHEEIPYVQGQKWRLCFVGPAMRRYPTSKVRETPVRQ